MASEKRHWFFYLFGFSLFLITIFYIQTPEMTIVYKIVLKPENQLYCHSLKDLDTLPDIEDTEVQKDKSIFFLETSCKSYLNGKIVIGARQACAVESAALMNPNRTIYLLYPSPGKFRDDKTESDGLLKNLISYPNVKILYLNLTTFIKGTPVEKLWRTGQIQKSKYEIEHASDILRLITLWKYGGIYLDLDVVLIKTLQNLPLNFAGAEDFLLVANGVVSFASGGLGHQHVNTLLLQISEHFDGNEYNINGPKAITRMLRSICGRQDVMKMANDICQGFQVFPPSAFYPIYWSQWDIYFDEKRLDFVKERVRDSYLIHVWNKLSQASKIPLYTNPPYLDFARRYCPGTIRNFNGDSF